MQYDPKSMSLPCARNNMKQTERKRKTKTELEGLLYRFRSFSFAFDLEVFSTHFSVSLVVWPCVASFQAFIGVFRGWLNLHLLPDAFDARSDVSVVKESELNRMT